MASGFTPCSGSKLPLLLTPLTYIHVGKACFRKHAYCLVRKHNAEPGQGVKPRRARLEACICGVANLGNGITIALRLAPCSYTLQVTQRPQAIFRGALKRHYDSSTCRSGDHLGIVAARFWGAETLRFQWERVGAGSSHRRRRNRPETLRQKDH